MLFCIKPPVLVKILWKEGLNSEGQEFHQYQQNEQALLISKPHWTQNKGIGSG
jgi:hypothetical protein